ncbi:molybdenum ABC transporter ATP-binding protein [Paenibacillus sp. CFBP13512]|jgi:iron complex transport system ATP-binding protein|uniref:ABC transporter ATP-binding protein n=1 Tax=Paenibacillus sp. CFBP13512 TaxID=2184007 RepID=UPI0010BF8A0B|nr:ABC transporter ATP-binding protein [Paenibacillus sp. CFBP13512]TKJ87775.1 molybdenum ABC transporter ATP-binding protein [Paenibacillus sp. CFBP13512]
MIIDIQHASWRRDQTTIINDISWQVQPGEHWCLLGLNGSGKTTLLNMVNGYIWPTTGSINVLDEQFGAVDLREHRKKIGWVSTSMQQRLHGHEKAENIVLSGKFASIGIYNQIEEQDHAQALSIMKQLDAERLVGRTYDTLSQGERQRILIARALMASPELLILDEPCTGLDIFSRDQLLHRIQSIAMQDHAPTLLYVTHHIEEIMPCFNKTLLIRDGAVFASGDTTAMVESKQLSSFFNTPVDVRSEPGQRYSIRLV